MADGNAQPHLDSRPLDLTSPSALNRLVRTRMLGGVGAREGDLPGYPISPLTLQRQLFAHDAPYRLRCQRLLRASNLSLERFVDECLIAAPGLL